MKLRKKYRNILICIIIIFSIIASVKITNASNFNTLRNRVEQAITKIEQVKSSNSILNKILNEMSNEIAEDGSNQETNQETDQEKSEESEDSSETTGDIKDVKKYNAQVELNILDQDYTGIVGNNKLRITDKTEYINKENEGNTDEGSETEGEERLNIRILDYVTGDEISVESDGTFITENQGEIVDLTNLEKNKKYQIFIENLEVGEEYIKNIESLVLEVYIDTDENIVAKITEATPVAEGETSGFGEIFAKLRKAGKDGILKIDPDAQDENIKIQYRTEKDGEWNDYKGEASIEKNTNLEARAVRDGKESGISIKVVDNIDRKEPQISEINQVNGANDREAVITAKITDDASGLVKYGISKSNTEEPDRIIMADDKLTEKDILEHRNTEPKLEADVKIDGIYENGDYYIWVWDTAGNCKIEPINVTVVKQVMVAEIVETSDEEKSKTLNGTQYHTLREAIEASPKAAKTKIKLLAEIYNENNEITDREITLNLDGFTVNNKSTKNPTLTINEGSSLTVINIDAEDNSTKTQGAISSESTSGIFVKENATLTLRNTR